MPPLNPRPVLSAAETARGEIVNFGGRIAVRLRVAGTAISCDVLGAPPARGVFEKIKLFVQSLSHVLSFDMEIPSWRAPAWGVWRR